MEYSMKGKPVVAVLGEKGGVGKSTIANVVAQLFYNMMGYKNVQYINLDTAQDYRKDIVPNYVQFDTIPESFKHLHISDIMEEANIDALVIDSGGYFDERLIENMQYIDTLIFPTTTDPGSYMMLKKMFTDYKDYVGEKQIIIVINQYDDSNRLYRFATVQMEIINKILKPLEINVKDVEFQGIKRSTVPARINSIDPEERITISNILELKNANIYKNFIGSLYDISESIKENIKKINK